jgi:NitT/TauT family transport system permease protein
MAAPGTQSGDAAPPPPSALAGGEPAGSLARRRTVARWRRATLLSAAVVIALWEALPDLGIINHIVVAPPSRIVAVAVREPGLFAGAVAVTVYEILLALALCCCVGAAVGVVIGSLPAVAETLVPVLEGAFAVPWVIIYPLIVAWFGIGTHTQVIFAFLTGVIPLTLTVIAAVRSLDRNYLLLCRSLGASRSATFLKVLAPAARPGLVAGFRVCLALVIVATLVSQVLISSSGLGYLINVNETLFASGHVYLALVLATLLAWLGSRLVSRVEGPAWRTAEPSEAAAPGRRPIPLPPLKWDA